MTPTDTVHSYLINTPPPNKVWELTEHTQLPVYIHIPKCGGTFTRSAMFELMRLYCLAVHKIPPVRRGAVVSIGEGDPSITAYCFVRRGDTVLPQTPDSVQNKIFYRMSVDEFTDSLGRGELDVFSVSIHSVLMRVGMVEGWAKIERKLLEQYKLNYFTSMRPSFDRAVSLYYVQKKRNPDLSCFHSIEPSLEEFMEFLMSPHSERNWVSSFLAYVFGLETKPHALHPESFAKLEKIMESKVETISLNKLGDGVRKVFSEAYSPYIGDLLVNYEPQADPFHINKTVKPIQFKSEDIKEACLKEFKNANSYDVALFEKFVEADEHMMSLSQIKNQVDTEIITMNT
jgi:hypothetical protein